MKELEKLIWYSIKIIIICKGFNPRERAPGTNWVGPRTDPKEKARFYIDVVAK
jgi:hypothetical protein